MGSGWHLRERKIPKLIRQFALVQIIKNEFFILGRVTEVVGNEDSINQRPLAKSYPLQIIRIGPLLDVSNETILDRIGVNITA
jgi:hypothetical protein